MNQDRGLENIPRRPRLCIVSLYSYPLFNPASRAPFGGSEVRVSLLAKELARRGQLDVCLIVFDHGQPHVEHRDGVTLYAWLGRTCPGRIAPESPAPPGEGTLGTRRFPPAASGAPGRPGRTVPVSLHWAYWKVQGARAKLGYLLGRGWRILRAWWRRDWYPRWDIGQIGPHLIMHASVAIYDEVNADIYMLHGNSILSAELAWYCRQRGKPYVFVAGSDGDYHPDFKAKPWARGIYRLPGYLLTYAVENATAHVVQSDRQADMLRQSYGRDSVVIRNPVDLDQRFPVAARREGVLWVGKSDWIKRPEIILDLARRLPDQHFTVIMTYSNPEIHLRCLDIARGLPNVRLEEYVPFQDIERYFARAALFVNTSVFEGFPNTFLQAAKYGVPIVSLRVDPGEMLSRHGCGLLSGGDDDRLWEQVQRLMTMPNLHAEASARCLEYVRTYHDKHQIVETYERFLLSSRVLGRDRRGQALKEVRL